MDAAAVALGVVGVVMVVVTYRKVTTVERNLAAVGAAVRRDVACLHSAHEYAREEHLRILTDVEAASLAASNEVRMAAGTVRAVTDTLVQRADGAFGVVGR